MKGSRCRISELYFTLNTTKGREANLRLRRGQITGESRDRQCWQVRWDGSKTPDAWHKSYIEVETGT